MIFIEPYLKRESGSGEGAARGPSKSEIFDGLDDRLDALARAGSLTWRQTQRLTGWRGGWHQAQEVSQAARRSGPAAPAPPPPLHGVLLTCGCLAASCRQMSIFLLCRTSAESKLMGGSWQAAASMVQGDERPELTDLDTLSKRLRLLDEIFR